MEIIRIAPITSLAPQEQRTLVELLGRLPDPRAADDMSIYFLTDGGLRRRVIAPTNPAATVGANVRSFGQFNASVLYLSSSGEVPEGISVADQLVLERDPDP
jgi:hypothetical protein